MDTRNTRQKALIRKELDTIDTFFSAEDLYSRVNSKHPEIGLATVYRFLKSLKDEKKIHSYVCDRKNIYSKKKKSHCHFVCERTGKVIHFEVDSLDFLKDKIPGSITSFQIEVRGMCDDCSAECSTCKPSKKQER